MRFLIRNPEGMQYELTDVDYFRREYVAKGFVIDPNPPTGYDVPDLAPPKKAAVPKAEEPKDEEKP